MRKSDVLHFAAATAFVIATSFTGVAPVQAAGLSAKQTDEISEFVKCQTYLLSGNLSAFEADSDCGHGPVSVDWKSLATEINGGGGGASCSRGYDGGYGGGPSILGKGKGGYGGSYCHMEKKHKKYKHKKHDYRSPDTDD